MAHRRLVESINLCLVILLVICLTGQCSGPGEPVPAGTDRVPAGDVK